MGNVKDAHVRSDKPLQEQNLLEKIRELIKKGKYRFSSHAIERRLMRALSGHDALYILMNGFHEKRKTSFDLVHKTWKYSIRGKTVDAVDIRVIVALGDAVVVITVIKITGEEK